MGFLQSDKMAAAQVSFSAIFDQVLSDLAKPEPFWDRLATPIPMTAKTLELDWMGDVPAFSEWVGERKIGKVRAENFRITAKKWANGLEVDEDDLEDDNLGIYAPKVQRLAGKAAIHKRNLIVDFLTNGFATTKYGAGYDGVALFSAAHKIGGPGSPEAAQSNLLTATLDDTGALDSAFEKLAKLKDEQGEPLGLMGTHLIVGPALMAEARKQLLAQQRANGETNTNYQRCELVVSAKITDSKWFLADLTLPMGPMLFGTRRAPRFRTVGPSNGGQESMESFKSGKLYFGVDARYNAAYGLWFTVIGSDAST